MPINSISDKNNWEGSTITVNPQTMTLMTSLWGCLMSSAKTMAQRVDKAQETMGSKMSKVQAKIKSMVHDIEIQKKFFAAE